MLDKYSVCAIYKCVIISDNDPMNCYFSPGLGAKVTRREAVAPLLSPPAPPVALDFVFHAAGSSFVLKKTSSVSIITLSTFGMKWDITVSTQSLGLLTERDKNPVDQASFIIR